MGYMTIDGRKVEFTDEPNVLSVIRNADIDIPTLCYHSELSVYGACRLCTVEDESIKSQGMKQLMAGGGVALIGLTLVPLLSGLFG